MKKGILALSVFGVLGLYACPRNPAKECTVQEVLKQNVSQEGLEKDLLTLVKHCHEFMDAFSKTKSSYCGLAIPETEATDNRISGTCCIDNIYNPGDISLNESYLFISHEPCRTPRIIINGALISGAPKSCNNNPSCLGETVKQIEAIGMRSRNQFYEDRIRDYAKSSEKRYDHGIKRK